MQVEAQVELKEEFIVRPAEMDDAEMVTNLLNVCSQAIYGVNDHDVDETRLEWASPDWSLADSTRVVFAPNGDLVGMDSLAPYMRDILTSGRRRPSSFNPRPLQDVVREHVDNTVRHLDGVRGRVRVAPGRASLKALPAEIETALSLLAWTEHGERRGAEQAFAAALRHLPPITLRLQPDPKLPGELLDRVADALATLAPADKRRLLDAMTALIAVDGQVTVDGLELLRAFASALDLPLPPA